ncbi:MAG TPA: DNA replication and repair protein RecF [Ignavibacteria bacterium]|nr:DNA replication and repair protein RecF [Ignavibacteria bacterium]
MILKKIVLKNFRNYENEEFEFSNKFNFIYGNNGQGKTNILEGISYTTFGKSFLGSAETDCIRFENSEFFIESEFESDIENRDSIVINYNSDTRTKSIHRNREKVTAFSSEIFGRYPLVFLSPKNLNITYGNPSDRRKFFDILISQTSRLYLDHLKDLARILKQKNSLLRNYTVFKKYTYSELKNLLSSYNEKLTEVSSRIIFKRLNFLREFRNYFERNFSFLLTQDNRGYINYFSDILGEVNTQSESFEAGYIKERAGSFIENKFEDEVRRGLTLAGPQRDDYIFRLNKNEGEKGEDAKVKDSFEIKYFASQGEHKTFLVALKLSEYDYLKDKKSTSPVLLLDDVLSELDDNRVSKIISHLKDYGQIFLTTTDKSYTENLREFYTENEISIFRIENGKVVN